MFTCIVKILIKKKKKSINAISNFKPIQRESTSLINASYSLYPQTLRLKKKKTYRKESWKYYFRDNCYMLEKSDEQVHVIYNAAFVS